MTALLYTDSKRENSRFRKLGKGTFGLAEAPTSDISRTIDALNKQTRAALRKRLHEMRPEGFEALIGQVLIAIGFDEATVEVTRHYSDGGVDVRGVLRAAGITEIKAAVQAKRWKANVGSPVIAALRGSTTVDEQGIIITTSDFSKGARVAAEAVGMKPISLISGDRLVELLIDNGIGVTAEQHTLLSVDDEWWGEVAGEPNPEEERDLAAVLATPEVTYPLSVRGSVSGRTVEGVLMNSKGALQVGGTDYGSPSAAGQIATGWKSCNGWTWWHYEEPVTGEWRMIDKLRR